METSTSLIEAAENTGVLRWVAISLLLEKLKNMFGSVIASTPASLNELMLANDFASVRKYKARNSL